MTDLDETWQILSHPLCKRNYSKKDACAILKVTLSVNYKYNVTLIQPYLQTVRVVQQHMGLADVDHARYCVLV